MKKRDILLSAVSGILLIFSFPNLDFGFFAWFALVPLSICRRREKSTHLRWSLDSITGIHLFSRDLYWIIVAVHMYGNVPLILSGLILLLMIVYLSLFVGTFTFLTRFLQIHFGFQIIILCPLLWVGLEYLRSFFLTGFPWAILGYSQHLNLPFIQSADILGAYGLSFTLVLVNVTLYLIIRQWPTKNFPYRAVIVTAIILLGFFIYGYVRIGAVEQQAAQQPSLKIGLVQGNIDQSMKWDESFRRETMAIYERLTLKVAQEKPDLILWPETATPFFFQDAKEYQPARPRYPYEHKGFSPLRVSFLQDRKGESKPL